MHVRQNRRDFLASLAAASAAAIPGARGSLADEPPGLLPQPAAVEPPPETTRLRVHHSLSLCLAPQYLAEELLRGEGFTEVQYVTHEQSGGLYEGLTSGMADIGNDFAPMLIIHVDAGDPITILSGVHVGCFEFFGTERVRSIRDLKGKSVAIGGLGFPTHVFLASMMASAMERTPAVRAIDVRFLAASTASPSTADATVRRPEGRELDAKLPSARSRASTNGPIRPIVPVDQLSAELRSTRAASTGHPAAISWAPTTRTPARATGASI